MVIEGIDFQHALFYDLKTFWKAHTKINNIREPTNEFKELFNMMVKLDPSSRATIQEIKQSRWYQGPTLDLIQLQGVLSRITIA